MILGIGSDLLNSTRIATLTYGKKRFIERNYTANELKYISSKSNQDSLYAMFFSAKESCSKAIGTGFTNGVYPRNIEIVHSESGKPSIVLHNEAKDFLINKLKKMNVKTEYKIHLTLSDELPFVLSSVVIEY